MSICSAATMRRRTLRLSESVRSVLLSTARRRRLSLSLPPSPLSPWISSLGVSSDTKTFFWGAFANLISDDETDMKALEEGVRAIEMDGLVWGASQLVPIGFGIKKLQINLVVEDDKVMMDDLQEQIAELEDYVQSSDVAAMQKL